MGEREKGVGMIRVDMGRGMYWGICVKFRVGVIGV